MAKGYKFEMNTIQGKEDFAKLGDKLTYDQVPLVVIDNSSHFGKWIWNNIEAYPGITWAMSAQSCLTVLSWFNCVSTSWFRWNP